MVVEIDIEEELESFRGTLCKLLRPQNVGNLEWNECFFTVYGVCHYSEIGPNLLLDAIKEEITSQLQRVWKRINQPRTVRDMCKKYKEEWEKYLITYDHLPRLFY